MTINTQRTLPIGSVVRTNRGRALIMIVSYLPLTELEGQKGYFDYGGIAFPQGMTDEKIFFFNKEDIQQVIFVGYTDVTFQKMLDNYDDLISEIPYKKLIIADTDNKEE